MGYVKNPFNSEAGKKILKENFRLVFAPDRKNPKDIEAKNLRDITSHFVDHTEQIINNIMKFSKGHRPIAPADAFETGIYVCPHCRRRDFMNLWEFEYLGYYKPGSMANESLNFQKYKSGKGFKHNKYSTLARVKCNKVYSCDSCYATYGKKPNRCKSMSTCDGVNFTEVGCGAISYAEHFTPSLTTKELFSNPRAVGAVSVSQNVHNIYANISTSSQTPKSVTGMPTAFEYTKNRYNQLRDRSDRSRWNENKDYENMVRQIPTLAVAYSNKKLMLPNDAHCIAPAEIKQFPISPMRLLRWPAPTRFKCINGSHRDYSSPYNSPTLGKDLGTSYWCTTRDHLGKQHGARWKQRESGLDNSMIPLITSPNPLPPDAEQSKKYLGQPIWRITLEMRPRLHKDETYQYSLNLPAKFSLQKYMEDISEIPINQGGTELCPNDPIIEEVLDMIDCDGLNDNDEFTPATKLEKKITVQDLIDEGRTDIVDILTKYAIGIVTGPKGSLSQISLEGCSERGVLMNDYYRGWVDYSSEVLNAAGDLVPRYLFINKKENVGREWLAKYCKTLNDLPKGPYTFMNFGSIIPISYRGSRDREYADHLFTQKFVSRPHSEEQLLPVLAGTSCSISTFSGNKSVFSQEFWRKLRGVKLKSNSGKTFMPIVTDGNSSFLPTYLISKMRLPICTLNGQLTKLVQGAQKKVKATHRVLSGVQYVDDSMMTVYTVMRCQTCNEIFDAGGVMTYRSSQGWVDSGTGLVTGKPRWYKQEAFDTELVHEMAAGSEWAPFTTSDGFRVCPNWGIDSMQKYGKAMLKGATAGSMTVGSRGSGK